MISRIDRRLVGAFVAISTVFLAPSGALALRLASAPLTVPGVQWFDGGQQEEDQRVAGRVDPRAVFARERSRTAYAHMAASAVDRLLSRSFPDAIDRPAGGASVVPAGARVLGYASAHAIDVSLPGHMKGIVESSAPVARRGAHGRFSPISLAIAPAAGGYAPANPALGVRIPNQISTGVSIPANGVTLTPVGSSGRALGGSGSVVHGASVVYANTQAATDTVVKPTTTGFQIDAVLRSSASPQRFYYRVGAPAGSKLVLDRRTGAVRVVRGGVTLAKILPPSAVDAAETSVPASMTVVGHTVVVSVAHRTGSYLYPVDVDPELEDLDKQLVKIGEKRSNWEWKASPESEFAKKEVIEGAKERLESTGVAPYKEKDLVYWGYETKGNSQIYEVKTKTSAKNAGNHVESFLELGVGKGTEFTTHEDKVVLSTFEELENSEKESTVCPVVGGTLKCSAGSAKPKNAIRFQQSATKNSESSYSFLDSLNEATVLISEPSTDHATTRFNTTSPEVEGEIEKVKQKRPNALYGSGVWLNSGHGALQLISKAIGIGISAVHLEYESAPGKWTRLFEHNYLTEEHKCQGIQCYTESSEEKDHLEYWTFDPKLPDGEDKLRYRAQEAMPETESPATEEASTKTVKVDTKAPVELRIGGLPYGEELSEKEYILTTEATDGEGEKIASSGVAPITLGSKGEILSKGLALFVDGSEVTEVGTQTGCTVAKGACTDKAEWKINGATLGAGHHAIVLIAKDNAGNEKRIERTLSVHHSAPVALGPGSLDLQSGDFALGATDVSMGSGLTVSRTHSSRATEAGEEGPLGPQWSLSLGTAENLEEMVDGSILLTDGNGQQAIFAKAESGGYEAPFGDGNLKLTLEENEAKEKVAFHLEDAAKHTKTKFTLPSSQSKQWTPAEEEGTSASDRMKYTFNSVEARQEFAVPGTEPGLSGITRGPEGNTWYTDGKNDKVGVMSTSGVVLAEYTTKEQPKLITTGAEGNVWVVLGKKTYDKITTAGVQTEYKFSEPVGGSKVESITAGAPGEIWAVEQEESEGRLARRGWLRMLTPSGSSSTYASTAAYLKQIAYDGSGHLWFTTTGPTAVDKWGEGHLTEYAVPTSNAEMGGIALGSDGNMWFAETSAGKIGKVNSSGGITEYELPAGRKPHAVALGSDNNIWFTVGGGRLGKITPSGSITELPMGGESSLTTGSDGKLWYPGWSGGAAKIFRSAIAGRISEPTEILAPVAAGVLCSPAEMKAGCRALKFEYSSSLSATGEAESEWGTYPNRLTAVKLDAYNPAAGKMQETAVADYSYDKLGRLRAVWDPRISALKTKYGYDPEGHITTLTQPGQESWAFTYGASASDAGTGRLLKAMQAPTSHELWKGEAVANTEAPQISGGTVVGDQLAASNGKWSGNPITYAYQWKQCNSEGAACTPIAGATNANYAVASADNGHKLMVSVSALNGDGSVATNSSMIETIKETSSAFTEYALSEGSKPAPIAKDLSGNLWYVNNGTHKIAEMKPSGVVMAEYALPAGSRSESITLGVGPQMWYTNPGKKTIGKISSSGVITEYAVPGEASEIAFCECDATMWYTNPGTQEIGKITLSGEVTEYPVHKSGIPRGIVAGPDGNVWYTNASNWIGKITTSGVVTEYKLPKSGLPWSIAVGADGNLWYANIGSGGGVGKITTAGAITEYPSSLSRPSNITAGADGNLWASDYSTSILDKVSTGGTIKSYSIGGVAEGVAAGPENTVWYTNSGGGKIGKASLTMLAEGETKAPAPGITVGYEVPLSGGYGRPYMAATQVEKWGQADVPVEATAIFPMDSPQGWPASSYTRATIHYLDEQGREVNVARPSTSSNGSVATNEYNEANDVTRTLSPDNRQQALEAGTKSVDVAKSLSTYYTYRSKCERESESGHETESFQEGTRLCEVEGPQHAIKYTEGATQKEELGRLHTKYFYDQEAPGGETYNLQTKSVTLAELSNEAKEEVEGRVTKTSYSGQSGLGWELRAPTSVTVDPEGKKLTTTTVYDKTTGQITETRAPAGSGGNSPHDTEYVYYTEAANTKEGLHACGEHPEWAGLICETLPVKQPETSGVPNLPVTVVSSYNMYNEPLVVTETFGSTVRTKTKTYDEAGRLLTSETTSTANTALPKLTDEYNSKTGVLEKLSTTVEGKTQSILSKYNTWGQLTEYTDADGNIAKYRYGGPENDGLLEEVADGSNSGTGKQSYSYNSTTKQLEELTDSAAGVFKASYDVEGRMVSETYPNAMCADSSYNSVGEAIKLEYLKTSECSEHSAPVWFSESRVPSARGETFSRSSTLASESYYYDSVGRLTEAQETPSAEGCSVRLYGYDEEANRTSQTTRTPGTEGKCSTEGGTVVNHTYDTGNRLTDTGVAYDSFGNITKLPAGDAEGHELSSSFYVSGAVASQTQNGVTNSYQLDPEGRIRETINGANATISHYDGSGETVVWTSETGGKSTRNIPGIDGSLAAIQTNGGTPVLQLHDLQGDIAATAALSPSETKVLSTYNSTEFGVPNKEKAPPKFAWLGAGGVASSLSSGVITYGATSYVPQIGRALQSETVEAPGIAPGGTGAGAAYISQEEPWVFQGAAAAGAEAPGLEAARERAAMEAAEAAAEGVSAGPHDPSLWTTLTAKEAITLAGAIERSTGEVEALAKSGVIKQFTMRWFNLIKQWWGKEDFALQDGMARWLYACAKVINETSGTPGRCKFKLDYFDYRTDESTGNGTAQAGEILAGYEVYLCWGQPHPSGAWTYPHCSLSGGFIPPK